MTWGKLFASGVPTVHYTAATILGVLRIYTAGTYYRVLNEQAVCVTNQQAAHLIQKPGRPVTTGSHVEGLGIIDLTITRQFYFRVCEDVRSGPGRK
jgi:hypothetical protein